MSDFIYRYCNKSLQRAVEAKDKHAIILTIKIMAQNKIEIQPELLAKACNCLLTKGRPGNRKRIWVGIARNTDLYFDMCELDQALESAAHGEKGAIMADYAKRKAWSLKKLEADLLEWRRAKETGEYDANFPT